MVLLLTIVIKKARHQKVYNTWIVPVNVLRIKSSKKCLDRSMTMFHGRATISRSEVRQPKSIQPNYVRGSSWPKCISQSVSRCARASRAILNHALIGEYKQRFFLAKISDVHAMKVKDHILFRCKRFKLITEKTLTIKGFASFLEDNHEAFQFPSQHDSP